MTLQVDTLSEELSDTDMDDENNSSNDHVSLFQLIEESNFLQKRELEIDTVKVPEGSMRRQRSNLMIKLRDLTLLSYTWKRWRGNTLLLEQSLRHFIGVEKSAT